MSTEAFGLPQSGSVIGVDIGYSPKQASSAICRLDWTEQTIAWHIRRYRWLDEERRAAIAAVADREVLVAAFDGPFRNDLATINAYRSAERVITRQVAKLVGKPGAANSRTGRELNEAANTTIADFLSIARLATSLHKGAVHAQAVVEAFPNSFLGVLLPDGHGVERKRGETSDRYFCFLEKRQILTELLHAIAGRRTLRDNFGSVTHHDDRAALVCALSALSVAANRYVAVGDENGRIILPPPELWNPEVRKLVKENCDKEPEVAWIEQHAPAGELSARLTPPT